MRRICISNRGRNIVCNRTRFALGLVIVVLCGLVFGGGLRYRGSLISRIRNRLSMRFSNGLIVRIRRRISLIVSHRIRLSMSIRRFLISRSLSM